MSSDAEFCRFKALVYMREARASKNDAFPAWRSHLVKWARVSWHKYIAMKSAKPVDVQMELF